MKIKKGDFVYYLGGPRIGSESAEKLQELTIGQKYYVECVDSPSSVAVIEGQAIGLSCNKCWLHSSHFSIFEGQIGDLVKISKVNEELIGEVSSISSLGFCVNKELYPFTEKVEILAKKNII